MAHYHEILNVQTGQRNQMIDITSQVSVIIAKNGIDTGSVIVYCPHTTASITINENADPDVIHDILLTLDELIPHLRKGYRHCEGNSDSHVKASLIGPTQTVLIHNGRLVLGTWQSIFFCEFDGPRHRSIHVQISD